MVIWVSSISFQDLFILILSKCSKQPFILDLNPSISEVCFVYLNFWVWEIYTRVQLLFFILFPLWLEKNRRLWRIPGQSTRLPLRDILNQRSFLTWIESVRFSFSLADKNIILLWLFWGLITTISQSLNFWLSSMFLHWKNDTRLDTVIYGVQFFQCGIGKTYTAPKW